MTDDEGSFDCPFANTRRLTAHLSLQVRLNLILWFIRVLSWFQSGASGSGTSAVAVREVTTSARVSGEVPNPTRSWLTPTFHHLEATGDPGVCRSLWGNGLNGSGQRESMRIGCHALIACGLDLIGNQAHISVEDKISRWLHACSGHIAVSYRAHSPSS